MSDIATLLILAGASDADKTGRGGGRRRGNIQAWIRVPPSRRVWGIAGWKNASGDAGWPGLGYCQEGELSVLSRLLGMRLVPHFGGSPERCQHVGRRLRRDPLPRHSLLGLEGLVETPLPGQCSGAWGARVTQSTCPSPPQALQACPIPPDAPLSPNAPCHRDPGTEPAFVISSHLLWQPCVCLVFTARDAWILSLLDHTRGASQRFPSSADIFLMVPLPPQPFPGSSPRSTRAAPAADGQPQRGCLWPM